MSLSNLIAVIGQKFNSSIRIKKSENSFKNIKSADDTIFLTDKVKKELYRDTFGIESFDMETAAIAGVCDKSGVPMLSLRKISDDADDASVEDYREMNNRQESCLTELLVNIFARILEDDAQW